ncbi:MAG: hypothetical protein C0467_26240 [Planctomycetaceae bacterium]|nr:hypothetical protein [Planctomycetaceae bacterium]
MRWLRDAFLTASRRNEELRKRLLEEAASLAATTDADTRANDGFLAETMFTEVERVLQSSELLELSDVLKKVYERQPAHLHAMKMWRTRQVRLLHAKRPPTNSLPASRRCENRRNRHPIFAHSICWNCSPNDVRRNS